MAGMLKQPGPFAITPHKVSLCILFKIYAPPSQTSVPFPFTSVSQHNRLGLFLLALTKSCDDIVEPKLDELINQLRLISQDWEASWLIDQLIGRLSSISSPDDLFNFFTDIRGILGGPDSGAIEDDQVILDANRNLGLFLSRYILAFNLLSFEELVKCGRRCNSRLMKTLKVSADFVSKQSSNVRGASSDEDPQSSMV